MKEHTSRPGLPRAVRMERTAAVVSTQGHFRLAKYGITVKVPTRWTDEMAVEALEKLHLRLDLHLANLEQQVRTTLGGGDVIVERIQEE